MGSYKEILVETLKEIAEKNDLENFEIKVLPLSTEGANYTSAIYKAEITSSNKKKLVVFAKTASLTREMRERLDIDSVFHIESHFYQNMVPILEKIQTKYNFLPEERFLFSKLYGSNLKQFDETLVLENLVEQGYTLYDRFKSLDWDYASRAVQQIAKFHALSFAYKVYYPDLYAKEYKLFSNMSQIVLNVKEDFKKTGEEVYNLAPDCIKPRLRKFIDEFLTKESIERYYGPGKWTVHVHGDYRASNILHKVQDGKLSSLIPVDFQTLHLGSPSTDLLYLVYNGTDEEFRKKYLEDIKDLYYNTLARWLRQMDLDPEELFSRKDFDEDFNAMLAYGLSTAIFVLPIVLVDPENAPKVDCEDYHNGFVVTPNRRFIERFLPIFEEFSNLGLI